MARTSVEIATADGTCPASLFRPDAGGPWPGVLLYMDGVGMRPALFPLAERIAAAGYLVLLPDLFYRAGPYEAPPAKTLFSDPAARQAWSKVALTASTANVMRDTAAFIDYLAAQPDARPGKIGTTGYCMGGRFALTAAGTFPDRVGAAASFHGGNLATDAPDSPHLLAPKMRDVALYIAGAVEDPSFPDDMKQRLEQALLAAGVDFVIETYEGLRHGWVPSDTPVHSAEGAERHFRALLDLFASKLR